MKNFEKYKTYEERKAAFTEFCTSYGGCRDCPLEKLPFESCGLAWTDLEVEDENPLPCPGCGNTDMHVHDEIQDSKVYIVCPNCGYSSPGEMKLESSVRRHNEIARAVMEAKKEGDKE